MVLICKSPGHHQLYYISNLKLSLKIKRLSKNENKIVAILSFVTCPYVLFIILRYESASKKLYIFL
jgi:hypothetical protein